MTPVLDVRDLRIGFRQDGQVVPAVKGVSFSVGKGETVALVGESGSGKSVTALSTVGLLGDSAELSGSVRYAGRELVGASDAELRRVRGNDVSFIFQEPMTSLNPLHTLERQLGESLALHQGLRGAQARARIIELLNRVGIRDPEQRLADYPHQFSGGQRQRLNIARALASAPDLIVCDEPVSALDIAIRAQILNLLRRIQREQGQSFLFISHDMAVVEHVCDDIAVMYLGKIIERASRRAFFSRPLHPYSVALMSAVPTVKGGRETAARRVKLSGDPPSPVNPPPGCRFAGRCPAAQALCSTREPALREVAPAHHVACHFVETRGGVTVSPLQG